MDCFPAQDQDDVLIVDSDDEGPSSNTDDDNIEGKNRKRKLDDKEHVNTKRVRTEPTEEQDDIIALDWAHIPSDIKIHITQYNKDITLGCVKCSELD